jgi:hypothetical protein
LEHERTTNDNKITAKTKLLFLSIRVISLPPVQNSQREITPLKIQLIKYNSSYTGASLVYDGYTYRWAEDGFVIETTLNHGEPGNECVSQFERFGDLSDEI